MPFRYTILQKSDIWYVCGFGVATGEDYFNMYTDAAKDSRWHGDIDLLLDMRSVKEFIVDHNELKAFAQTDKNNIDDGLYNNYRLAMIARNFVDETVVTFYRHLVNHPSVEIKYFHTLSEALSWLRKPQALSEINREKKKLTGYS